MYVTVYTVFLEKDGVKIYSQFCPEVHGKSPITASISIGSLSRVKKSCTREKYNLMLRDGHSDYKWFDILHILPTRINLMP